MAPLKKGQKVWICYTLDRIWHPSKIVDIRRESPRYEVKDYVLPGAGRLWISRHHIRTTEPKGEKP